MFQKDFEIAGAVRNICDRFAVGSKRRFALVAGVGRQRHQRHVHCRRRRRAATIAPAGRPADDCGRRERDHSQQCRRACTRRRRGRRRPAVDVARGTHDRLVYVYPRIRDIVQAAPDILLQTFAEETSDGWGRRRRQRGPVRLAFDDRRERVRCRFAAERAVAGQHLVEHAAERPDVRSLIDCLTTRLLRRHVRSGPEQLAIDGRCDHRRRVGQRVSSSGSRGLFGEAKVQHLDRAVCRDDDVRRLEIAMNDPALVSRVERIRDLPRDYERLCQANRRSDDRVIGDRSRIADRDVAHSPCECLAFDQLHHQRRNAARVLEAVQCGDVRMIE